jgi:hypothetical protein
MQDGCRRSDSGLKPPSIANLSARVQKEKQQSQASWS